MSKGITLAAVLAAFAVVHAQDADPATLVKQGEAAVRHGDYADADVLFAKAATFPDSAVTAPALWYLGKRAAGENQKLAAEGFLDRLLRLDARGPYAGRALTWLANLKQDDPVAAESFFKQALALEPDSAETKRSYAFLLRKLGRGEEADALNASAAAPQVLERVQPQYTNEARAARIQGTVVLSVVIGTDGLAGDIQVVRSLDPGLDRNAVEAVRLWRFKPAAAPARASIEINFRLSDSPGVYRAGNGVAAPQLLSKTEPEYTETARAAKVQGTVALSVDIGPDGVASNFEVLRSLEPGLDQKAIEAVRKWRFKPGTKDGAPVTVRATIEVNFRLM